MALDFKQALREVAGHVETRNSKYAQLLKAMEEAPIFDASPDDVYDLEWICCAFLHAVRIGRYEKAGLVTHEPNKREFPIYDWDNSYRLEDTFTKKVTYGAEVWWINERMIQNLADMAKTDWWVRISAGAGIVRPGLNVAVQLAHKQDWPNGFPDLLPGE